MSLQDLKTRARRIVEELFSQGDLAVADELMSADIIHHSYGAPLSGVEHAKEQVVALRRAFPDYHLTVDDELAEGDKVVQRITAHGTHERAFLDVPPTGNRVTYEMMQILRFGPDGKVTEHWSTVDLLSVYQQLGAAPVWSTRS
jgi:predicted ester cyclase